jgi:glycosyltransferase involved in cell wall biosynthesis
LRKQIRVVHVIHWPKSGITSLVRELIRHFDKQRFQQHVIFFENDAETMAEFQSISETAHALNFSKSFFFGALTYKKLLSRLQPDILHAHSFLPDCLGALFASHSYKVCTVHSAYPYFKDRDIKSLIKRYTSTILWANKNKRIIAVSDDVMLAAKAVSAKINVQVIENGIDTNMFLAKKFSKYQNSKLPELLTVGRLSYEKGYDILLHAFRFLIEEFSELRLTIIGDGPEKKNLVNLADMLGLTKNVNFTGWANDPANEMAVYKSFIYVSSSRYEGLPLSVAEAMALGFPVVATKVSGVTTLIRDRETGFLAKPDDPKDLASIISIVLRDNKFRTRISKQGQEFVCKNFDIRRTVKEYEKVYEDLYHSRSKVTN